MGLIEGWDEMVEEIADRLFPETLYVDDEQDRADEFEEDDRDEEDWPF